MQALGGNAEIPWEGQAAVCGSVAVLARLKKASGEHDLGQLLPLSHRTDPKSVE